MERRRSIFVVAVLTVLFGTLIGCGNGNDPFPGVKIGGGTVRLSVAAGGPNEMAPLAAVRGMAQPTPAILPSDLPTQQYRAVVKSAYGTFQVASLYMTEDRRQLRFEETFRYAPEFIVEIYHQSYQPGGDWRSDLAHVLFTGVISIPAMDNTQTIVQSAFIGANETALSLAFLYWKNLSAPTSTFSQFLPQVSNAGLAALSQRINLALNALSPGRLASSTFVFAWPDAVNADAEALGISVPAPPDQNDVTPPTVTGVLPANNAVGVATGTTVRVTCSEAVLTSSLTTNTFNVKTAGGQTVAGTFARDGLTVVFTPASPLTYDTEYVVTITGIQDQRGNTMTQPFSSGFRTQNDPASDITPPSVLSVTPANGVNGIATSTTITLIMSEALDVTTVNSANVRLLQNAMPVSGTLFVSGSTQVTFTPSALAPLTTYTVQVSGVKDLAGNSMSLTFSSTFTTMAADQRIAGSWRSYAFPISGTSATVYDFTATQTSTLVMVNNTSTSQNYAIGGTMISASRRFESSMTRTNVIRSENPPDRCAEFHCLLREYEHQLPTFRHSSANSVRGRILLDTVGNSVTFKVLQDDGSTVSAPATCRYVTALPAPAVSGNTNVYVDNDLTWDASAQSFASQLVSAWSGIYTTIRQKFGAEPPAGLFNGLTLNDDLTILIVAPGKIDPLDVGLAGFFYSGDLYSSAIDPNSNQRKILYLNYLPGELDAVKGVLAHEFQHMVNFYQRKSRGLTEDDWLNEACSGYAEHLCGFGIPVANRSKAVQTRDFLAQPAGNSLTEWTGSHEDYGQVYLFGTWLGLQYGASGSIAGLLSSTQTGTEAVSTFAGKSFTEILAEWSVGLYVNDTSGETRYGIPGLNLRSTFTYAGGSVTLAGPAANRRTAPFSDTLGVAAKACSYLEVTGGTGQQLQFTVPITGSFFEIHHE